MFSGNRNDRYAPIALGLVLLALCFIGLFEVTARHYASQEIVKYQTAYPEHGNSEEYAPIIASLREFDPREDTYAQWIMAAFSVAATFASIWAVLLLRDTLAATREAVRAADEAVAVTREMGQRQMRAYVHAMNPTVFDLAPGKRPYIKYQPKNAGQTPAHRYRQITMYAFVTNPNTHKATFGTGVSNPGLGDIAAGQHLDQRTDLPQIAQPIYDALIAKQLFILFYGVIRYVDVFGRSRRTIFRKYVNVDTLENGCAATNACRKNNKST